jgi:hypothetical protein
MSDVAAAAWEATTLARFAEERRFRLGLYQAVYQAPAPRGFGWHSPLISSPREDGWFAVRWAEGANGAIAFRLHYRLTADNWRGVLAAMLTGNPSPELGGVLIVYDWPEDEDLDSELCTIFEKTRIGLLSVIEVETAAGRIPSSGW